MTNAIINPQMPDKTYHLTAAIPYVNAKPHLGHVFEWFQADTIARYQRLLGKEVSFTSGADENSLKNVQAAEKEGLETQHFLDKYSKIFEDTFSEFDISLTSFRRGSDEKLHWPGVQKLWELCQTSGDIYKKRYQGLYCVGCESFYTETDLVDGKCPEHSSTVPEHIEEENYFFRLSKYEDKIRELIMTNELSIVSDQFRNEMLGFINQGLEDFSISRSIERARGVGVPIPGDDNQRMYVWFDALTIYMTAIGFGYDQALWEKFWPADLHVIGKGINRFHSVYWIGMLLSAGLELPKKISVHGYITTNGEKMSKSLGNVIDPYQVITKYGLEPIRYYLLKAISTHGDGDFTHERFRDVYTADLANAVGNVCSRVAALVAKATEIEPKYDTKIIEIQQKHLAKITDPRAGFSLDFAKTLKEIRISDALSIVLEQVTTLDRYLSETKPWTLQGEEQILLLTDAIEQILNFAHHLQPFMPKTAKIILDHFLAPKISKFAPLFPRLEL